MSYQDKRLLLQTIKLMESNSNLEYQQPKDNILLEHNYYTENVRHIIGTLAQSHRHNIKTSTLWSKHRALSGREAIPSWMLAGSDLNDGGEGQEVRGN